jgi:hypothetical protein
MANIIAKLLLECKNDVVCNENCRKLFRQPIALLKYRFCLIKNSCLVL